MIIDIHSVSKTFQIQSGFSLNPFSKQNTSAIQALNDVNFSVQNGEFVALLGPNGAGKSTLIKIMIGALAKSSGSVSVMGVDPLEKRSRIISKLGIVFGQRSRLWYDLPVRDSFELTKRLYGVKSGDTPNPLKGDSNRDWERHLIESIDIAHLLDRQVKKLSLGEKMRCELVNTLLYNPELIFLDEPTIGLDIISKEKIREALLELNKQGKTIILTSHDTGDIERLCNRVIIVNHGKIVADQPINEFMQLDQNGEIQITTNQEIDSEKLRSMFSSIDSTIDLQFPSSLQATITYPKPLQNQIIKELLANLDIQDIAIQSTDIEKILATFYAKDQT